VLAQAYCWRAAAIRGDAQAAQKHRRAMEAARSQVPPIAGYSVIARRRQAVLDRADALKADAKAIPVDDVDADALARQLTADPGQRKVLGKAMAGGDEQLWRGQRQYLAAVHSAPFRSLGVYHLARQVVHADRQDHFALRAWIDTLKEPAQRAGGLAGGAATAQAR
jgi:hypothetical protein